MVEICVCAKVDGPAAGTLILFCGSISLEVFQSPLTVLGSKRVRPGKHSVTEYAAHTKRLAEAS